MKRFNAANERIKRDYAIHLTQAHGYAENSIVKAIEAITAFEEHTGLADLNKFSVKQAISFKAALGKRKNKSGALLSKATVGATLRALKSFFHWLAERPGFRSRIRHGDAEYFTQNARDEQIARTVRPKSVPTIEQVKRVLAHMPSETAVQRRDRAVVAFLALTGARVGALISLQRKHVDGEGQRVFQDSRDVHTKFGKAICTIFFPVGSDILNILIDYLAELDGELLWGPEEPLFPATKTGFLDGRFCRTGAYTTAVAIGGVRGSDRQNRIYRGRLAPDDTSPRRCRDGGAAGAGALPCG